jgi:lipopolysaccharide export system permease protein
MISRTLSVYFGKRFVGYFFGVFFGIFALVALIDYIEMTRRTDDIPNISALIVAQISLFRLPQLLERLMPFCALIAAMVCYLNLSRRNELVVARAAGMSAWQFISPAIFAALILGALGTVVYNPMSAAMQERSKRLEAELFGERRGGLQEVSGGFWVRQRSADGQAIINAQTSSEQGARLAGVSIFRFDTTGQYLERIEAKTATLQPGFWQLNETRAYRIGAPPSDQASYRLNTNLTMEQVRESFATPETVPFWQLPDYINTAEHAGLIASGYRFQYHRLLARPFLLAAMVLLAVSFSLRFFRSGGMQKMVLGGIASGFLLYVLSKVTEDLSKAQLMHPAAAAWLPVLFGGLTGLVALLHQEDG